MKSIKKYIALGLTISLVFAVSNLAYGVFKDSDYTSVNMKFNAELPNINSHNKSVTQSYDKNTGTYKVVISGCIYEGRELYKDENNKEMEELKFKLNANETPLEGANVTYIRNGENIKIIIEKTNYNNSFAKKYNFSIQPYLIKVGGGILKINQNMHIFIGLEKSNNNQSVTNSQESTTNSSNEYTEDVDIKDNVTKENAIDKEENKNESLEESSDKIQESNKEETSTEENMTEVIENTVE
ncbi:hypothetical protein L0P85_03815 [Terrisporobacter glycolicus]|nr:hypothetical protein L0P85_03815 [Terrisporobacter glycolicus]